MNRKTACLVALLPIAALFFWGCGDEPTGIDEYATTLFLPEVEGHREIALDPFHPSIATGESLQLTACWKRSDNSLGYPVSGASEIAWSSDSPEVAEVSKEGWIKAKGPGLAIVTVTVTFGSAPHWQNSYSGTTPVMVK